MRLRGVVARNLRRIRHERGLSQDELAHRAGVYRTYIGLLEREQHAPTVDTLEKLAEVLEVDPVEFFSRPRRAGPDEPTRAA